MIYLTASCSELVVIKVKNECCVRRNQKPVQDEWTTEKLELLTLTWAESSHLKNQSEVTHSKTTLIHSK